MQVQCSIFVKCCVKVSVVCQLSVDMWMSRQFYCTPRSLVVNQVWHYHWSHPTDITYRYSPMHNDSTILHPYCSLSRKYVQVLVQLHGTVLWLSCTSIYSSMSIIYHTIQWVLKSIWLIESISNTMLFSLRTFMLASWQNFRIY